ncbi:hypothetical protein [Streptomyces showdoensis]|uniref:hypothetical protein n=1 Tax=Streptomyces showdoensis TaxID=68268 RepID=UPI000F509F7E|nr:hypothetical protein [Streptomyces showdoensis]
MIRNIVGSVLALAGATAAVWSPFRAWYDGRHGRDYAIDELFTGITDTRSSVIGSILLPFAFAALLTVLGVVLRSRLLVALAGLVVLGFTILWMVRVGQAEGSLTVGADGRGLGDGVANALGGGVLLLLGAVVMSGRSGRHVSRVDRAPAPTHPTLDGPTRPDQATRPTQTYARPPERPYAYGPPDTAPPPASDVPRDPARDETPPPPGHRG